MAEKRTAAGRQVVRPSRKDVLAPMEPLRIAAFGDSVMWGQGLARDSTFLSLIAAGLGRLHGRTPQFAWNRSRSGAQIAARGTQREAFLDTFPELFGTAAQRQRFLDGTDEGAASELHGEIPAAFPTIRWQVKAFADSAAKRVDVALITGGANDIGFDEVVNPRDFPGEFIEEFDGRIREISHDDLIDLIRQVRAKCPSALILVFGYFAPLSYQSSDAKIREFFKHESDDAVGWWINSVFDFVDVDRLILEAKVRAMWAQGRSQYWMRAAVDVVNSEDRLRGAGVLFVPSGVKQENAVFAKTPFVHEDFTIPTKDAVAAVRKQGCPRVQHLSKMKILLTELQSPQSFSLTAPPLARKLSEALAKSGPQSLVKALVQFADTAGGRARDDVVSGLRKEINRIQRALIASFFHPNAAGAKNYASIALERYQRHVNTWSLEKAAAAGDRTAPGKLVAMDATLRRYGLRSTGPLAADVGHLDVDSIALKIVTKRESDKGLAPDIFLVVDYRGQDGRLAKREFLLNFPYRTSILSPPLVAQPTAVVKKFYAHFEPAVTNLFTLDTGGDLRLAGIVGFKLRMGKDPFAGKELRGEHGSVWRPLRIRLQINGREVLDKTFDKVELRPQAVLKLDYAAAT